MKSVLMHKSVSNKLYVKINFMVKTDQIVISEHGKTEKSVPLFHKSYNFMQIVKCR